MSSPARRTCFRVSDSPMSTGHVDHRPGSCIRAFASSLRLASLRSRTFPRCVRRRRRNRASPRSDVAVLRRVPFCHMTVAMKFSSPNTSSHKLPEVVDLVVIDADEDHAVLPQQIPREIQPRIHHVQPLGVEAAVGLGVGAELAALGVHLAGVLQVGLQALGVVVGVDEVVAGVVGRVDVDHLDLAQVRLLQELEHLEVVALDDEVLGGVEVDALLRAGAQGAEARRLDGLEAVGLARPVHAVALLAHVHRLAQRQLQPLEVDLAAFGADLGEQAQQFLPLVLGDVVRAQVELFGFVLSFRHRPRFPSASQMTVVLAP